MIKRRLIVAALCALAIASAGYIVGIRNSPYYGMPLIVCALFGGAITALIWQDRVRKTRR
jgi:peptidoglycan/LPS O-acetylase OafA/YrhL